MVDERFAADEANRRLYVDLATRSGGSVDLTDGLTLVTGTHPSPVIANVAFRTAEERSPDPSPRVLELVTRHFERVGHGAALMTSERRDAELEAAAAAAGWRVIVELPVMVVDAPMPVAREALLTRWVHSGADLATFREVLAEGFADDDDERGMVRALFASPSSLAAPGVRAIIAEADGAFIGAGAVYRFDRAAVVGWITVLASHRRRGLGSAITAALTDTAFGDGADLVILQASPQGFPVYSRMGFRQVGRDRIWFPPSETGPLAEI